MQSKKYILLTCILLLGVVLSYGQSSTIASGGKATGTEGSASYSVGQVAYQTHPGTNGSVAEGVQQPYEISVVTGLDEAEDMRISIAAYPNPTTDYLTLKVKNFELTNLNFQLYDNHGKILQSEKITGNQTNIVMSNLVPANYFVKVMQGNKELKSFKIIKN